MFLRVSGVLLLMFGALLLPTAAQGELSYTSEDNVVSFALYDEWTLDDESITPREHYRYVFVFGDPNPFVPVERSAILMDVVNINQNPFFVFDDDANSLPDYLRGVFNGNPIWQEYQEYKLGSYESITVITPGAAQTILFQPNDEWVVAATVFAGENTDFDADVEGLRNILLSITVNPDAEASRYLPYPVAQLDLPQTLTSDDDAFQVSYPAGWKVDETDIVTDLVRPFVYWGSFTQSGDEVEMTAQVIDPANGSAGLPSHMTSVAGYMRAALSEPIHSTYSIDGELMVIVEVDNELIAITPIDDKWIGYVAILADVPDAENIAVNMLQTISVEEVQAFVSMFVSGLAYPLPDGYDVAVQQFNDEEGDETVIFSLITGTELTVQAGTPEMLRTNNADRATLFRFIEAADEEVNVISIGGDVIGTRVIDGTVVLVFTEFVGDESTGQVEQVVTQILTDIAPSGEEN